MAKARDIRKIQLYIIITIAALIGGAFAAVRITQRKRAKKVDGILDACMEDPNCVVDKGGNVENGNGNGNGGNGIITNAVAESKARALVDDIWGFTFTIKKGIWNQLMAYDDDNFAKIVRKANSYIQNKEWGLTYGAPLSTTQNTTLHHHNHSGTHRWSICSSTHNPTKESQKSRWNTRCLYGRP